MAPRPTPKPTSATNPFITTHHEGLSLEQIRRLAETGKLGHPEPQSVRVDTPPPGGLGHGTTKPAA
jgi:hypothetical protein